MPSSRPAVAALIAAAVLASCANPRRPTVTPPRPTSPDAPAPIEQRVDARGFSYRPGVLHYFVTSEATVDVRGDTLPADTLQTMARVTYRIGEPAAERRVTGTVDAYAVRGTRAGLVEQLPAPVPFGGILGAQGLVLDGIPPVPTTSEAGTTPDTMSRADTSRADSVRADTVRSNGGVAALPLDSAGCRAPLSAPLALARDLLVVPPERLEVGTMWSDTTVARICRGGIPVTTTTVRHYQVLGSTIFQGRDAVAIERTSEITVAGAGLQRQRGITLTGNGRGRATLYASVERGAVLGADAEFDTDLTVESGTRRQQFAQQVRQRVRLQ